MLLHIPESETSRFPLRSAADGDSPKKDPDKKGLPLFVLETVLPIAVPAIRGNWTKLKFLADIDNLVRLVFSDPIFTVPNQRQSRGDVHH